MKVEKQQLSFSVAKDKIEHKNSSNSSDCKKRASWKPFFIFLVVLSLIFTPIVILLASPSEREDGSIRIEALTSENQDIRSCDENCKQIVLGEKVYPLQKSLDDITGLRNHLIDLAKQNDGLKQATITLFNEEKLHDYFDISFDISGSVIGINNKDIARGADVKYSDVVFEKIRDYLKSSVNPGATIRVRLYGPALRDNPCNEILNFYYDLPKREAKFAYSDRDKLAVIKIGNVLPPKASIESDRIVTNDLDEIIEKIGEFYDNALYNSNSWCHTNTYLDRHLAQVADDKLDEHTGYHYILTNDGEFSFGNYFITAQNNSGLLRYINTIEPFLTENVLCRSSEDTFVVIGMDYNGNLIYRKNIQDFFSKILSPCSFNFMNI